MRDSTGDLRAVYFYPEDLEGHVERRYNPGKPGAVRSLRAA